MAILNWIKYGQIKIGTLKLQLLRVPDSSLFGLGLSKSATHASWTLLIETLVETLVATHRLGNADLGLC